MSKLYAIRQTGDSNYWYDFVEDFTSVELDEHCVSNDLVYVKECQNNLGDLNPAWKNSEIVEFGIISDLEAKLAESEENCFDLQQRLADKEEQCRECKHLNKKIELNIKNKLLIENHQLEQQLAEKEKENTKLKEVVDCVDKLKLFNLDIKEYALMTKMMEKLNF